MNTWTRSTVPGRPRVPSPFPLSRTKEQEDTLSHYIHTLIQDTTTIITQSHHRTITLASGGLHLGNFVLIFTSIFTLIFISSQYIIIPPFSTHLDTSQKQTERKKDIGSSLHFNFYFIVGLLLSLSLSCFPLSASRVLLSTAPTKKPPNPNPTPLTHPHPPSYPPSYPSTLTSTPIS